MTRASRACVLGAHRTTHGRDSCNFRGWANSAPGAGLLRDGFTLIRVRAEEACRAPTEPPTDAPPLLAGQEAPAASR